MRVTPLIKAKGNRLHKVSWFHGIELFEANFDDQVFERHAHSGFAIGTISQGVGGYRCRGAYHVLPPRTLSLMNPEEPHTGYAVNGLLQYKMLYVSEEAVRQILDMRELPGFRDISPDDPKYVVSNALHRLAGALNAPDHAGRLGIEECVYRLLAAVFARHGGANIRNAGRENASVRQAAEIIDAHVETCPTADLSISDIAIEVGLSANYLIQCFSRSRGISPHKYLILKKICRAKKFIAQGHSPLEAALSLGFYDQAHFIRHFRKVMGITPGRMIVHREDRTKKTPEI